MKTDKYLIWFLALFVVTVSAMPTGATEYPSNGVLNWKGETWSLTSGVAGPGNNYWNNEGAWIDNQNRMHLTIVNEDGKWQSTMLNGEKAHLYGTYTWTVDSPALTYDKNSVVGLFTYLNDNEELDIEFARWGDAKADNLEYSVQPYKIKGNNEGYLIPSSIDGSNTIHTIEWTPKYIRFTSKTTGGKVISDYTYTNVAGIPKNPQYTLMNLWLFGSAPSDGKNIELIISDFSYTAYQEETPSYIEDPKETPEPVENTIKENIRKHRDTPKHTHKKFNRRH